MSYVVKCQKSDSMSEKKEVIVQLKNEMVTLLPTKDGHINSDNMRCGMVQQERII